MATDDQDPKDQKDQDPPEDQDPPDDQDPKDDPPKDPKKDQDPELAKAITRRDKALKEKQALAEKVRELEEKLNPGKADPVKVANRRLVSAEARVVLTDQGIPKDDHAAVMEFLGLDTVDVGDDGTVDSDTIMERVEKLSRIFGGQKKDTKRTPKLDTRDRGGEKAKPEDAATARRKAMLGR